MTIDYIAFCSKNNKPPDLGVLLLKRKLRNKADNSRESYQAYPDISG